MQTKQSNSRVIMLLENISHFAGIQTFSHICRDFIVPLPERQSSLRIDYIMCEIIRAQDGRHVTHCNDIVVKVDIC